MDKVKEAALVEAPEEVATFLEPDGVKMRERFEALHHWATHVMRGGTREGWKSYRLRRGL